MTARTRVERTTQPGGRVLLGPLLTGKQFARHLGLSEAWIRRQPFILRIGGTISAGAAYPMFQVEDDALRLDVCLLSLLLRRRGTDLEACDWLVRAQPAFAHLSPIDHLDRGGSLHAAVDAITAATESAERQVRPDLEALRAEWVTARDASQTDRWTHTWDRVARDYGAHPLGV